MARDLTADLDDHLLEEILSHLSVESLSSAALACKRYRRLISNPRFHLLHARRSIAGARGFISFSSRGSKPSVISFDGNFSTASSPHPNFPFRLAGKQRVSQCTASAGLLFCRVSGHCSPLFILCNPLTRFIHHIPYPISLPEPSNRNPNYLARSLQAFGLAVEPPAAPKLIAFSDRGDSYSFFTYSLCSLTWQRSNDTFRHPYDEEIFTTTAAAYCHGALHWLRKAPRDGGGIMAFNVAKSRAYRLPLPDGVTVVRIATYPTVWLGTAGGRLAAAQLEEGNVAVWEMEEYGCGEDARWGRKRVLRCEERPEDLRLRLGFSKAVPLLYGDGRCVALAWAGGVACKLLLYTENRGWRFMAWLPWTLDKCRCFFPF
ncbi:hypothetical protein AXF42_Ash015889 [Apostasia shenzhenica]|uniref:F-box domain-containing protein n=1 Tax=Apostasia shenzhenica TaxID=1088818 RepID=A0A2H9ZXW8_9ASPA|nr:hypothetical protein AXF42_Ash015889 [Apostasia shenzhenica]